MMIALATPILRIMLQNGTMPESALDHVYYSEDMKENINCASIKNSATDHLSVIINYKIGKKNHKVFAHQVTKRCLKKFNVLNWNDCLSRRDWILIEKCVDLDEKVKIFTENINTALDEIAPFKTFKIRSSYKFGLSDKTKELMKLRDLVRNKISFVQGQ